VQQISDRQVSMGVGAPMIINDLDCDVEDLEIEDFGEESEESAHYLIGLASLSRIGESNRLWPLGFPPRHLTLTVSSIYFCHLSPSRLHLSADEEYCRNAQLEIRATLNEWHANLSLPLRYEGERSHHLAVVLQIVYK